MKYGYLAMLIRNSTRTIHAMRSMFAAVNAPTVVSECKCRRLNVKYVMRVLPFRLFGAYRRTRS